MTYSESVDKHFVSEYVKRRESYYYNLLEEDYLYVQLLSNEDIAREYRKIYQGASSRDAVLGDAFEIKAQVLSVVLGESVVLNISVSFV